MSRVKRPEPSYSTKLAAYMSQFETTEVGKGVMMEELIEEPVAGEDESEAVSDLTPCFSLYAMPLFLVLLFCIFFHIFSFVCVGQMVLNRTLPRRTFDRSQWLHVLEDPDHADKAFYGYKHSS
jgi:hypothetical protein